MDTIPLLVQLNEVSKTYGDHNVRALSHINLDIRAGEFVSLMGPSGCGKSTLLNIMGGIDRPNSGQVLFDGSDLLTMKEEQLTSLRRTRVGFIFQFFNLLSTLTVAENVALPLELADVKRAEIKIAVEAALQQVGMKQRAEFYPSQLSGGEMQRVAIARALIHKPKLVVADEPTGNLDTENGAAVLELIRQVNEQGTTVVMATHSAEASGYAQRLVEMRDGCIVGEKPCLTRP